MWLMFITVFNANMDPQYTKQHNIEYPTRKACMAAKTKIEKKYENKGIFVTVLCLDSKEM